MIPRLFPVAALLLSAGALALTGCEKPQIRVYLAPRDATPAPAHVHNPNDPNDKHDEPAPPKQPERPRPKLAYTLPPGWTEAAPGQVSLAAFAIQAEGAEANVNITPLPDLRGRESLVVNMYREKAGLPPIDQANLGKELEKAEAAGGEGQLVEVLGSNNGKPTRLITIIAHRDGRSWFYRIAGDDALVTAQKPAFLEFVKNVKITEAADAPAAPATPAPAPPTPASAAPATESAPTATDAAPKPQP